MVGANANIFTRGPLVHNNISTPLVIIKYIIGKMKFVLEHDVNACTSLVLAKWRHL